MGRGSQGLLSPDFRSGILGRHRHFNYSVKRFYNLCNGDDNFCCSSEYFLFMKDFELVTYILYLL